jgi:phospholipid/cholesterol/gamma-HCH transport system substrate-binding protein/paraquat-inducible protein B
LSDEAHYARVGAFVFGGILLAVIGAIVIGGGSFFQKPIIVETVFDESVQGLEVGSPVKLRGVKIGTISYIGLVGDNYILDDTPAAAEEANRVLVRMKIERRGEVERTHEERVQNIEELAEKGLRLRITPLGITGTSFIQADYVEPGSKPPMTLSFTPEYIYVPSAQSTISQLSSAAERLMSRIDKLDVETLITNFDKLLATLNVSIGEADLPGARKSVGELLTDLRSTSTEARKAIASVDARSVGADARKTLDQMTATMLRLQRLLDSNGDDLATTLDNLRVTSENLREASETARAYPSFLLFGSPPDSVTAPAK